MSSFPIGYVITLDLEIGSAVMEPIQGPAQRPDGVDPARAVRTLAGAQRLIDAATQFGATTVSPSVFKAKL